MVTSGLRDLICGKAASTLFRHNTMNQLLTTSLRLRPETRLTIFRTSPSSSLNNNPAPKSTSDTF